MASALASLVINITGNTADLVGAFRKANQEVGGFGNTLKKWAPLAGLTASLTAGLVSSVGAAASFEAALSGVSGATGATAEEMKALRTEALAVGKDTSKSASEAVAAFGELAKSGISVADITAGAGRTVVALSEATGASIEEMATLISDTKNVFSVPVEQLAAAADTLGKTAGASSISIQDLQQSLAAGGLVAKQAGLSIDEFSTAIGIMGNQGLKASDAGTSLKSFIAGLTPTSKDAKAAMRDLGIQVFDAAGNFKSFPDILASLSKGFSGLTEQQRASTAELLFGSDGVRAFAALVPSLAEGVPDAMGQWGAFTKTLAETPGVAEQSARRMAGFKGEMEKFKGSIETLQITVGTLLLPVLTRLAIEGAKAVDWLLEADWTPVTAAIGTVAGVFGQLADAVAPALKLIVDNFSTIAPVVGVAVATFLTLSTVVGVVTSVAGAVAGMAATISSSGGVIAALVAILGGPLTLAIGAVVLLSAALALAWVKDWGGIQGTTEAVIGAIREGWPKVQATIETVLTAIRTAATVVFDWLSERAEAVIGAFRGHWPQIQAVAEAVFEAVRVVVEVVSAFIETQAAKVSEFIQAEWPAIQQAAERIWNAIKVVVEQVMAAIEIYVTVGVAAAKLLWAQFGDEVITLTRNAWKIISTVIDAAITIILQTIRLVVALINGDWATAWDAAKTIVQTALNAVKVIVQTTIDNIATIIKGLAGALGDLSGILVEAGKQLVAGLWAGISAAWDDLVAQLGGLVAKLPGPVKKLLGIESPSRVFAEIGAQIPLGMAAGIRKAWPAVEAALADSAADLAVEQHNAWMAARLAAVAEAEAGGAETALGMAAGFRRYWPEVKAALTTASEAAGEASAVGLAVGYHNRWMEERLGLAKEATEAGAAAGAALGDSTLAGMGKAFADVDLTPLIRSVRTDLPEVGAALYQAGTELVAGLMRGIAVRWADLITFLTAQINALPEIFKQLLGIRSPSTVMASIGVQIGAGLAAGIVASYPLVQAAMLGLYGGITAGMGAVSNGAQHFTLSGHPGGDMIAAGMRGPAMRLDTRAFGAPMSGRPAAATAITVNLSGPIYGFNDFEEKVKRTIKEAILHGGFHGVIDRASGRNIEAIVAGSI